MIPEAVLRETPFIKSIEMEVREKALAEGREEGLQEGREEGRQEAREVVIVMLLHAITRRFPKLDLGSKIGFAHDIEALKHLFLDLDQIADEETLRQRLDAALTQSSQG